MQHPPAALGMGDVLRIPAMRRLWAAQIVSSFGDFLALFAVIGVLTFRLHGTPAQVTGLQVAYLMPLALLGVVAGVFVDRWPPRPTLVLSDVCRAGLCLLLFQAHSLLGFYAVMATLSVFSAFFGPAQGVAVRGAVPLPGLRAANALLQQVVFAMSIVGPGVASLLYARFGPGICFGVDAASFLASALLLGSVALHRAGQAPADSPERPPAASPAILREVREGLGFLLGHAGLLFVILALAAGVFVLGCFGPLIAVYVRDSLRGTPTLYGYASGLIGVGMLGGTQVLTALGERVSHRLEILGGLLGIAAGLLVLAAVPRVGSTLGAALAIGFAVAGIVVPANTLLQAETPPALLGRVGSTVMSVVVSAQIAGLLLSGALASRLGVRGVFLLCAALLPLLCAAGAWATRAPAQHDGQRSA